MPAARGAAKAKGKVQATLSFFKKTTPAPKPSSKAAQNAAPRASPAKKSAATRSSPRAKAPVAASPLRRSPRKSKQKQPEDGGAVIAPPTACAETKGDEEDRSNATEPAAAASTTATSSKNSVEENSEASKKANEETPPADAESGSDSSSDDDSSSSGGSDDDSDDDEDEDDEGAGNGIAPELQALIDAKMKAMQAQYRSFDKQQRQQKLDDLMAAVDGLKLEEAELALDMCDKNEIAAAERIMGDQDFLKDIRDMLEQRQRDADRAALRRQRAINRENAATRRTGRRNRGDDDDDEPGAVSVVVEDGTAIKIVGEGKDVQKKKASARPRPEGLSLSAALRKLAKLKEAKAKSSLSAAASPAARSTSTPTSPNGDPGPVSPPAANGITAAKPAAASSPRTRSPATTTTTTTTTTTKAAKNSRKASPAKTTRTTTTTSTRARRTASPAAAAAKTLNPAKARRGKADEKKESADDDTTPSRRSGRVRKPRQFLANEQAQEVAEAPSATTASPKKQTKPRASPKKRSKSAAIAAKPDAASTSADAAPAPAAETDTNVSEGNNASKEPEIELTADDLRAIGWSEARIKAYSKRHSNPNTYYYRFNAPNEPQATGAWSTENHKRFMEKLKRDGVDYQWGLWSMDIPGRVGYQCSNYYRKLIMEGVVEDANYVMEVDEKTGKKKLKFLFKNKTRGKQAAAKATGKALSVAARAKPKKPAAPRKRASPRADGPAPKKKKKKKRKPRRGRGDTIYADDIETDDDSDDDGLGAANRYAAPVKRKRRVAEEDLLFPGVKDIMTSQQIEIPAMSPHGYVMEYDSWIRALQSKKSRDKCPFTKQRVTRRQLIKLTKENVEEHRHLFKNI